jgi:hypothetical protein
MRNEFFQTVVRDRILKCILLATKQSSCIEVIEKVRDASEVNMPIWDSVYEFEQVDAM